MAGADEAVIDQEELPGRSVSIGKYCKTVLATAGMEPRWPGLKLPCAIMTALRSKMAVEKSSPSRTPSEKAVCRKVTPSSSAIEIREFQITVSVMGSTLGFHWQLSLLIAMMM